MQLVGIYVYFYSIRTFYETIHYLSCACIIPSILKQKLAPIIVYPHIVVTEPKKFPTMKVSRGSVGFSSSCQNIFFVLLNLPLYNAIKS